MMLSKHHYARELAKRGNTVYFLNPPVLKGIGWGGKLLEIKQDATLPDFYIVSHQLHVPYQAKFHAERWFQWVMKHHIKSLPAKLGGDIDIVWSFDLGNYYPFRFFDKKVIKVFHPVDEPVNPRAILSGNGADIIFSVTTEILDKYAHTGAPRHHIQHGVSTDFLQTLKSAPRRRNNGKIQVGYSGNFLRPDMDHAIFLQIIKENPDVQFHCWGSYRSGDSNIGGGIGDNVNNFLQQLQTMSNVTMYGVVGNSELAKDLAQMDAFLISYDINKDQSKGTNYHKLMEYIATGKVIVSNNVTNYKNRPDLVQMPASRENNNELPGLFKQVIGKLDHYNSESLQQKRVQFAEENTYPKQLERIETLLKTIA